MLLTIKRQKCQEQVSITSAQSEQNKRKHFEKAAPHCSEARVSAGNLKLT